MAIIKPLARIWVILFELDFAHQYNHITPDVLTLAKGLGNGVPIGACLAKGKATTLFTPGTHGSTFGGNPLVCKTALSVLEIIEKDKLLDNATKITITQTFG
jgi:acetylornithine aminotransferase